MGHELNADAARREQQIQADFRPIIVGEANPYGGDPAYALYPIPENSAGGRLCRLIMALSLTILSLSFCIVTLPIDFAEFLPP